MQAIEVVTSMESLLAPDAGLLPAIKRRGVPLIANTPEEENCYERVLEKVYHIRNVAVHTGRLPSDITLKSSGTMLSYIDLLKEGIRLCGQMIEKIIVNGSFPDWRPTKRP
jgi:hypothetical protein